MAAGALFDHEGYRSVLEDLRVGTFPREAGTPGRRVIGGWSSFYNQFFDRNYGRAVPMFIGHNALEPAELGGPVDLSRYVFSTAFGDLDTGGSAGLTPLDVWSEVRRTEDWLRAERLGHAWKYSGSKAGFHVRIGFREERHGRAFLARWENAFWRGLRHHLTLRSVNIQCAEPARFERLPYTPYVHRKDPLSKEWKLEDNFCVPIPSDWIESNRFDKIWSLSYVPHDVGPVWTPGAEPVPSLEEYVRRKGWEAFSHEAEAFHPAPTAVELGATGGFIDLAKEMIPRKMCLRTLPYGSNPRHEVRRAWVIEVLAAGAASQTPWDHDEIQRFVDGIAEESQWEDRANVNRRRYQVTQHFRKMYRPKSCHELRSKGICVENAIRDCPLFRLAFPAEYEEFQARAAREKAS